MNNPDAHFDQYRNRLFDELAQLGDYVAVYRHLLDKQSDSQGLCVLNTAVTFFRTVERALFSAIILQAFKLADTKSRKNQERGFTHFLQFCRANLNLFSVEKFAARRSDLKPDDPIMIGRLPITDVDAEAHIKLLESLSGWKSIELWRDKSEAHFDKAYFFDRDKLAVEAPLDLDALAEVICCLGNLLDCYSSAFDGQRFARSSVGTGDINRLFLAADRGLSMGAVVLNSVSPSPTFPPPPSA